MQVRAEGPLAGNEMRRGTGGQSRESGPAVSISMRNLSNALLLQVMAPGSQ